jgi:hypothetical protein
MARANPKTPARDDNTRTAGATCCDMSGPTLNASHPVVAIDSAVVATLIVALIRPARVLPRPRRSRHIAKNPAMEWE